jgi:uncharacterized protein (TIGR03435 family)
VAQEDSAAAVATELLSFRSSAIVITLVLVIGVAVRWSGAIALAEQRPATTQDPRERFEVVSVRQSIPDRNAPSGTSGEKGRGGVGSGPGGCKGSGPQGDPGRIVLSNNSLYTLIAWAYGLDCGKAKANGLVSGGPAWVGTDQWVIQATIPVAAGVQVPADWNFVLPGRDPISDPKLQRMLQKLLVDRFKLALHREPREIPVYDLTVAKGGPKLQHPENVPCTVPGVQDDRFLMPPLKPGQKPYCTFLLRGSSMADLAMSILGVDRPVIDKTGIAGTFDLRLLFDPAAGPIGAPGTAPSAPAGPSIFTAIQDQLGLKLESAKGGFEGFVIDSVQRPSEN